MCNVDEAALDRVAYIQGDYTHDPSHECSCCGRHARTLHPLILSDRGWVCVLDEFCRAGTSAATVMRTGGRSGVR